ncbi:accessory factor UbiK family protein [Parasphingorhabdus halotolerans]|uniref:Accessory factor UbiK family protein n=1 Tax=Parasphingorhabdus halotolerans TaxID=2725558 RepID=A0A6H2DNT9_9SPHN|nr:accessory factor UbiK family protein [Parasphingorhabdus halotolerans]QJB70332.1 accessory factor UbiK family protein [Parasphingorhabdus halotolerans]
MQSQNRFFDDLSKVLNGIAGTVAGVGREAEAGARERAKEFFGGMDFVSREEFEAVKEMAAKARAEADALKKRVDALEKAVKPAAKSTTTRKAPTKKAPAKGAPQKVAPRKSASQ